MEEMEHTCDPIRNETDMTEENLANCFNGVLAFLQNKEGFMKFFGNALEEECKNLVSHLNDLHQHDCGIVVSGDTSVGKTSLINKILGEKVLFEDTLEATTKVYKIRHSNDFKVQMHHRGSDPPTVKELSNVAELHQELANIEKEENRNESINQIDVMLPFTKLKGNVTIVDTPGTGDSEEMKKIVKEYLPKAVAFVFVLDVSRAGGLQKDRVLQTMKDIHSKLDAMLCFDPRDVLFIRNKWDCVNETEERKIEIQRITTAKIKREWSWVVDKNIFDTVLKEGWEEKVPYSLELQRFQAAILRLIQKKDNIRFLIHSSYLTETIKNTRDFIANRMKDIQMNTEEKEVFSKCMTEKIEKLSKDIKTMQDATDDNVKDILWKLASDLEAYILSPEFKDIVVNTEPELTSYWKFNINREVQKRIENAVVDWAKEQAPEIINREIEKFILREANRIYSDIRMTQSKWTDITDSFNSESVSLKIAGTVFGGAFYSLGRFFWALFLGPQATIVLTAIGVVTAVTGGIIGVFDLDKDAKIVIDDCFKACILPLSKDRLYERVNECMIGGLYSIHDKIFKEQLPKELKNLERSLNFTKLDQEGLKHDATVLRKFLREVDDFQEQLSEINQSISTTIPTQ